MKLTRYNGNFVSCKNQVEAANQEIATARQGMQDRIKAGYESHYKSNGCWYPEGTARIIGVNYWCLPEFAPTTNYPQETLTTNQSGNYLDLAQPQIIHPSLKRQFLQLIPEIAEADKRQKHCNKRILIPEIQGTFSHDSAHLDEVDIALFTARSKELAKAYGNFLKNELGVNSVTFYQIGNNYDNIAAGFWLHGLGHGSGSGFGGIYFNNDNGSLFGVAKRVSAEPKQITEGDSKKVLVYNPSDLRILQGVKEGKIPNISLEKIIKRFK